MGESTSKIHREFIAEVELVQEHHVGDGAPTGECRAGEVRRRRLDGAMRVTRLRRDFPRILGSPTQRSHGRVFFAAAMARRTCKEARCGEEEEVEPPPLPYL